MRVARASAMGTSISFCDSHRMKRALVVGLISVLGCGGSSGVDLDSGAAPDGAAQGDGGAAGGDGSAADGATAPPDAGPYGAPSTTYPAFTPYMGQLSNNGGAILTAPVLVTVTWDGDTGRGSFEAFGDGIGASSYWSAAVGEYGVGATTSGSANHAHVGSAPPAQMSDNDIHNFISSNVGSLLPQPTSQTIYVVYLSTSTSLVFNNQNACQAGVGGYHDSFAVNNAQVAYAVLPRCGNDAQTIAAASHEIGEAATDPHPTSAPGIAGFDDPYLVFDLWQRGNDENGDACEFFKDSYYTEPQPFAFSVQRLWSNKAGPLGHSPCQPYAATYFNMAPLDMQDITVDLSQNGGPANFKTKGYTAALNQTIQIPLGFYSDAATTGPWTVTAAESNPLVNPVTGRLTLSVDSTKPSGVNGEETYLNVTVTQVSPLKAEMLTVISTLGSTKHYLPLLIGNP
jgi:hypothetical protein